MAVQVRPVHDSSMLSQQLPEQIRKASLIELTTMKEKNNNNSINSVDTDQNKSFSSILSFNEQAKEKHMHLESEINGKGKQQQQELEHEHDDYEVEEEGDEAQKLSLEVYQGQIISQIKMGYIPQQMPKPSKNIFLPIFHIF